MRLKRYFKNLGPMKLVPNGLDEGSFWTLCEDTRNREIRHLVKVRKWR